MGGGGGWVEEGDTEYSISLHILFPSTPLQHSLSFYMYDDMTYVYDDMTYVCVAI